MNNQYCKKFLVLSNDASRYINTKNTNIISLYNTLNQNFLYRIIRKFCLKHNLFASLFFGSWYKKSHYSVIVLFDTGNANYIFNILKKRYPYSRLILWYWNPVSCSLPISKLDRSICEIWSYSVEDCKTYNLFYNTQFYTLPSTEIEQIDPEICNDVYFIGVDKNRAPILTNLKHIFDKLDISFKLVLIRTNYSYSSELTYSEPISYQENQINIINSKCILDIADDGHKSALSLRIFEATINKKKFITNDSSVMELKFYNPSNIFILEKDNLLNIKEFINSPFVDIEESKLNYYEYHSWILRFDHKSSKQRL